MAELTAHPSPPMSSCCSAEAQASCCEPSDKAACCGESAAGGSCGCSAGQKSEATPVHGIRETVRERYAQAARAVAHADRASCGCAPLSTADEAGARVFGAVLYDESQSAGAPAAAVAASLGCGVPTAVAALREGETALDLGSGAGADVLIGASARRRDRPGDRPGHDR